MAPTCTCRPVRIQTPTAVTVPSAFIIERSIDAEATLPQGRVTLWTEVEFDMEYSKASRRTEARARRALLTRADFAERIARFAADLALAKNAIVAGYDPIRDEADPRALMSALAALGHPLALPCVGAARTALVFRTWKMGDALAPNAYGIAEPLPDAREVAPNVVLVPLLAFDAQGHRLGYGGGYYDRTFESLPDARRIGVAYAGQELPNVPREPHDHRLDLIVTENGVRLFANVR